MGIDVRQKRNGDYPGRCLYYKGKYVLNQQLVADAVLQGVFYCKDIIAKKKSQEVQFGMANTKVVTITIETLDNVSDLTTNDFVLYEGTLYRVISIVEDDDGKSKQYSSRPITKYTIELRA